MPRVIKINHIGIATEDLSSSLAFLSDGLGLHVTATENLPGDAVRVNFLPLGETRIELLEPSGDAGPVHKFLANRGPGIHHICLEVEDLPGLLERLKEANVELIDQQPRPGAHGTQVAFVHPHSANGVLVELVDTSSLRDRRSSTGDGDTPHDP